MMTNDSIGIDISKEVLDAHRLSDGAETQAIALGVTLDFLDTLNNIQNLDAILTDFARSFVSLTHRAMQDLVNGNYDPEEYWRALTGEAKETIEQVYSAIESAAPPDSQVLGIFENIDAQSRALS